MTHETVLYNHRLYVSDGRITAIETAEDTPSLPFDRKIEARGKYLLPGFSDTHFHQHRVELEDTKLLFKLLIAHGITSARSMAQWNSQDTLAIRHYANQADVLAPYYVTTGPQVNSGNVKTPQDAIAMVEWHRQQGYDYLKVHGNLDKDSFLALLQKAGELGIPVVGHAQRHLPLAYSLRMHSLAHVEELVNILMWGGIPAAEIKQQNIDSLVQKVKNSGITVSPTLSILELIPQYTDTARFEALLQHPVSRFIARGEYEYFTSAESESYNSARYREPGMVKHIADLIEATRKLTRSLSDAGVPLLVGSDNLGFHIAGFGYHDELEAMQRAGLTPYQVLKAATLDSARYLKRQHSYGSIEPGKAADFILLDANPLEDIRHSRLIQGVMVKSQWLDRVALDNLLDEVLQQRLTEWQ